MLKVFLGGEGNNDIGNRWQHGMCNQPGTEPREVQPGVVEVLLRRVRPTGWRVAGVRTWQSIRKYRAGAARHADHGDEHSVRGLVLHAYEDACEMLAFVRDGDDEKPREEAIGRALETVTKLDFAAEFRYELAIVGGVAKPKLEGWILCLRGVSGTDDMTRARVDRELRATDIDAKATLQYVAAAETCALPSGHGSLPAWLRHARATFTRLIDGGPAG